MLYLASQSPRRAALLRQIGVQFKTVTAQVDEAMLDGEAADAYACRLAQAKARAGTRGLDPTAVVLGADTVVVLDNEAMGKPATRRQAREMLCGLSGREHRVLSAVAVVQADCCKVALNTSLVRFRTLTEKDLDAYLALGEYADKAGAYAIQGVAAVFVERLSGSYSGVMGLPLYELADLLARFGVPFPLNPRGMRP